MYINAEETAEEKGMSGSYTPLEEDSYLISPKFKASCWKILDLSEPDSPDWKRAVKIFYDRLNGRFLAPIKSIEEHADPRVKWFNGFSIIALDCLVIETLYQFYYGVDETDIGHNSAFWRFLSQVPISASTLVERNLVSFIHTSAVDYCIKATRKNTLQSA